MPKAAVNGTVIHYHAAGRGTPIIFVHPPLITSKIFNYQYATLPSSFRVITFDIRGHGVSGLSEVPLSYPLVVEDMKQLLDYLEVEQAVICGYSAGGQLAIDAMLAHPDRFIGGVLVSTPPYVTDWWNKFRMGLAAGSPGWLQEPVRLALCMANADSGQTFKNLYRSSWLKQPSAVQQYFQLSKAYDASDRLAEVKQPVLLLYGEKDRSFHRYALHMKQVMPGSTLVFIKDGMHQIPTRYPAKMNGLIQSFVAERLNLKPKHVEDNIYAGIFSGIQEPPAEQQVQH